MMCSSPRLGLARRLLASSVSLAVVLSSFAFAIASPTTPVTSSAGLGTRPADSQNSELTLTASSATATRAGVLLRWTTNSVPDNLGFNVYRLKDGRRTRANKEIIPGAIFAPGTPAQRRAGYSYSWFDRGGSADSTYFIESVNADGAVRMHNGIVPVSGKGVSEFDQAPESLSSANENTDTFEKRYPAEEPQQTNLATSSIETQWEIAAQTALKIAINKEGWYRVTQLQMVAAGFNPVVDIRNLRLFVDGNEVAINTSQLTGPFGSSDYIEFYGRGLDTPTTDKHIYYLIAGTTPGKRVIGGIQLDGDPPPPPPGPTSTPPVPAPSPTTAPGSGRPVLSDPIFYSWVQNDISYLMGSLEPRNAPEKREVKEPAAANQPNPSLTSVDAGNARPDYPTEYAKPDGARPLATDSPAARYEQQPTTNDRGINPPDSIALARPAPAVVNPALKLAVSLPQPAIKAPRQLRKRSRARKRTRRTLKRQPKQEHSHALVTAAAALPNYDYTIQIKERFVYFSSLLNGDEDNFFGRVINSPVTQTLNVSNPDLAAAGPATLEFALQGVLNPQTGASHQVSVAFNGVTIGSLNFAPLEHPVRTFSIPIAQIQNGNNGLTFTKTAPGNQVSIVDYIRFTYPHTFKADANALKFNLRGTQTVKVDGFSTPSVRLIDYTDPLNIRISKPVSETSALGYAITVPVSEARSKAQRLLYAFPQGQFDQPAALSLSQPSSLNQGDLSPTITSGANFLIISHKNFIASLAPLVSKRQSEGRIVAVVDVEDIYDEFGYGAHGPQAIKNFLEHALTSTNWVTKPLYIIFAGDASLDPRNYQGVGDFDFVPTKLVDATFSETATDDWVGDFHGGPNDAPDGISDIPVGRLPFRTVADANLIVSKIVNFVPQAQPQSAMLVADEDQFNAFGFAATNDVFQSLLPVSMSVQRLNRAPQPPGVPSQALTKADIVNGFNAGPTLVGYSGHGNVDFWTGAVLFTSGDALGLTNGNNKLSFVVVMDCLNGYFQDPSPALLSLSEALLKAPNGGAVAAFASSGLTIALGQHQMGEELYTQLYSGSPMAIGDAIKIAKGATFDIDVKRTWIFFGDPSLKIR
jgi:hypothetical protein